MNISPRSAVRGTLMISFMLVLTFASTRLQADTAMCGGASTTLPFTDVPSSNIFFCSIAEAYFSALTNGTTATTFSPSSNVPREQMAAFVTRTLDQSLKRGSRRAAFDQYWAPTSADGFGWTNVGILPQLVKSDGADVWVANGDDDTVDRVRASDGKLLETWMGTPDAFGILSAKGQIFITGNADPGQLYQIDPTLPVCVAVTLPISLGAFSQGISFDGARVWTADFGSPGSVSIVTLNPLSVNIVTTGFTSPTGILFDGANIWVTDQGTVPGKLLKLDSNGAIQLTVNVGDGPSFPVFDGTNIWVPNFNSNSVTLVRASTGAVLATLTGNSLSGPRAAAFDGERVLITNATGNSVSLWKAADLTPLGSVATGASTSPNGACSDGLNFWLTLRDSNQLVRF